MKTNEIATTISELATKAKTEFIATMALLRTGDYDQANIRFKLANEHLLKASQLHSGLLKREPELSLQLVYSEDLLMTAGLYQSMIVHFKDLYQITQRKKERSKWNKL
ncbi:MAG: PTS lactose/cellobiose transporter subunit IIA [Erysipelotrichaceae bacterium]|nr:PTS lactose/cellobiose transporter subunit IIA [Erysipelotrichaceae bacterium]